MNRHNDPQSELDSSGDQQGLPIDVPTPPITGTVDDDDDPADERADENEAPVREKNDLIEANDEFYRDDEDREETSEFKT